LRRLVRGITGKQIYATHDPKQFSNADYRAIKHTNSVEVQIAKNTENFEKRFKQLLLQASLYGSKPICVSQPHLYTRTINGTKKGVENVFEYNGTWYNGLDYDTSISELSKSMKRLCLEGNGYFFDMASKKFETGDFYDGVHMTPTGTQRLGSYMYKEFIVQKLRF
jgi:hypothetical protein